MYYNVYNFTNSLGYASVLKGNIYILKKNNIDWQLYLSQQTKLFSETIDGGM